MKVSSVAWSLLGLGLPPLAALLFIPSLLASLGTERFGLLSLIWALTALSGLLDLGIGRATTKLIAGQHARGDLAAMSSTAAAAIRLTWFSGLVGGGLIALSLAADLRSSFRVQQVSAGDFAAVTLLLALIAPLQALAATYRGIAEGMQQFRGISLVRMCMGVASFAAPWIVARATPDLVWITASLLATRLLALSSFALIARRHLPRSGTPTAVGDVRQRRTELLRAGGWLSVSAIVSPVLVQADRFAIASMVSAAAVTSYTIPFDIVTQLLILPSAIATVALPSLSGWIALDPHRARHSLTKWVGIVGLLMAVITTITALLLPEGFAQWLGRPLAAESVSVGRWLCLGVWLNGVGAMYYAWLHAHGRFRTTAMLHIIELPFYAALLAVLLQRYGVVGAAIAWVLRVGTDTLALCLASGALSRNRTAPAGATDA
jgi:O-antigen/teichoic acid export membrane protein